MNILEIKNRWKWGYNYHLIFDCYGLLNVEFKDNTTWGFLSGLVVHPSKQNQGIATYLMKKAEEITLREGFNLVCLSVEKQRKWQFEWYKRLGYEVYDEDEEEYWLRKYINI